MSIEKLTKILLPPKIPKEVPTKELFAKFESEVIHLPKDYKSFIMLYGTGSIDDFIWIYNPVSDNINLNLTLQIKAQTGALRELSAQNPNLKKYKLYPEEGGLLPFGITDNGDLLMWKTEGEPDKWKTVLAESRLGEIEEFDKNLSTFLYSILNKSESTNIFPDDFPENNPIFDAAT